MKISKATYWTENLALTRPYTIAYERIESVQNLFVHLLAEDGSVGLGVASPAEEVTGEGVQDCRQALADNLEDLLPGTDLRHLTTRRRDIEKAMPAAPAAMPAPAICRRAGHVVAPVFLFFKISMRDMSSATATI